MDRTVLFYIQEMKANGYAGPVVVISVVDDDRRRWALGRISFSPNLSPHSNWQARFANCLRATRPIRFCLPMTMRSLAICWAKR